ncbi:MAG: phosphoenolpyruvate carboxykinase [Gemmatimonadales bacterium]|nr:phosphoenolpyruvate carboxykinase [Gemmatimonadales bacterium]NIN10053.1 phosphoenolpyruvate carboxykinase [Gemmatimonadales bacterium]NIQ98706.1 phosphoenolpyruvate carboxykinase [Gemmatimonadales bacterium]NIS63582.1 phosphoenolpyruvate carboxykinase [Gemmatimonadales bacterium]
MQTQGPVHSEYGLENHGIRNVDTVYWNLSTSLLYEEAIRRREGHLAHLGPLVVRTGHHTGRAPNDKFLVHEPSSEDKVWWGKVNRPMEAANFETLYRRLLAYLQGEDIFVQDCYAGADPIHRLRVRVICETAWHSLFARNLFIQAPPDELAAHVPQFTVIHAPGFHAVPELDGTRSEAFVVLHFGRGLVLIGGTHYAGEIKKSIFTVLNYLLPQQDVLTMHCSANIGGDGDVALFFGLSGTGKTTLSTERSRTLIGDDEHGWSDHGVFNLEGGCYAKVIRLSPEAEPEIYETTRRFGTILENVGFDSATGHVDLDDDSLTENTRAAYPISHIPNATRGGTGGHPKNILMLTADAFGVLPPVARLTPEQATYHFLSGYTAKVAGTEVGIVEPKATFSACFGAPFMALSPTVYAKLLGEKIDRHGVTVWLVNTGWTGGPYGVGQRMSIGHTRAMVHAALDGALHDVPMKPDPNFGVAVPSTCPGVPTEVLNPRNTWQDKGAYDQQARKLAAMFSENFQTFADEVPAEVRAASPRTE